MTDLAKTKILRATLIIGATFNFVAALMLAFPNTLGKFVELPESGSVFYTALLSFIVGTFGVVYSWLAFQKSIDRPLLTVSAIGKIGVFIISFICWQAEAISFKGFAIAIGDLMFGLIFLWWLVSIRVK